MKKYLLSALIGLASAGIANAQTPTFTVASDTVKYTVYGAANVNNNITNIISPAGPMQVTWRVLNHNIPSDWQSGFGMCDNITCYGPTILAGGTKTTDTFSHTCDFHVQINLTGASSGTYSITAELKDAASSYMDTVTFVINKWPTGVANVTKATEVTLYPQPAHDELNIVFDANAGIRNIAISNLIGKTVSNYKVTGNSANLDVSNIPVGVYFARLSDARGNVVATRKFIRQ